VPNEEHSVKSKPGKKHYQKRGLRFLLIGIALMVFSYIIFSAGIKGGIILALIDLAWIVLIIMGLVYLIKGLLKKT
jgi:hypothetical protein